MKECLAKRLGRMLTGKPRRIKDLLGKNARIGTVMTLRSSLNFPFLAIYHWHPLVDA